MGSRKKIAADKRKEAKKDVAVASLRKVPTSPRKMRQVADNIRGVEVEKALGLLRFSTRHASKPLEKLLMSAIANWEAKNEKKAGDTKLVVKTVMVDESTGLKRMLPAPQGRAYRMVKRSNHVTLIVDTAPEETAENKA
ncbi:MAG: 50S ribosomal protein L22 [Flavobacteriales bacterium]|jgi:large subunit ribosomal protein L22|nr:50S ribosomal protein L22 [Flavobacteriales bacterium]MBK7246716.1 50S ribosomal protein L22 [Flavobacteriales bacterium]MBK7286734.1 50S ribosomal protein L22 [Flavobacteriales bacterium]MBK9060970.1 50S ribosomal protein L22 [Flavobacteriales bacterium]MBK9598680.1 50S ribosomal protein L22 [Flavobacteriales bacterium]